MMISLYIGSGKFPPAFTEFRSHVLMRPPYFSRVMAAALSLTFGRGGALVGNLIFGFLIDLNCVIPIVLFSAMLFGKC